MYEALEHWKQYKQEQNQAKLLFEECGFQRKVKQKQAEKQMDNFINKLVVNNGVTNI